MRRILFTAEAVVSEKEYKALEQNGLRIVWNTDRVIAHLECTFCGGRDRPIKIVSAYVERAAIDLKIKKKQTTKVKGESL